MHLGCSRTGGRIGQPLRSALPPEADVKPPWSELPLLATSGPWEEGKLSFAISTFTSAYVPGYHWATMRSAARISPEKILDAESNGHHRVWCAAIPQRALSPSRR